ncbi:DUF2442 domain-containing protein [Duganella sp. FT80W]|uniref:DUF2442 domain-containing protein n=1 Tax=Duganella guangzhouensis TaxID=2666084 RepID=A0A6I2L3T1_9BURK|nr:DUF2442 domain-containing protein [Duganella guangzhouensis]MRW92791.1 DUF2442 domain-containing protein [Duganella guangzhouensis]
MDWDVIEVKPQGDHLLLVRFKDGLEGTVKFLPSAFRGVFAHLRDTVQFERVAVLDGVVTWPGEIDLAPDAMHAEISRSGQWILS